MPKKLEITLKDKDHERLMQFKKIVDTVLGKKTQRNDYVAFVLNNGIEKLLREAIGEDNEALWEAVLGIQKKKPKFFSDFIVETLFAEEEMSAKAKERFRERLSYIG